MGDLLPDDDEVSFLAKPPKRRATKAKSDGSVQRCFDAFSAEFFARWGMKPEFSGGRDGKLFKELAAHYGVEVVVGTLIPKFFASREYRVVSSDYSVPAFRRNAQALMLEDRRPSHQDARTASNVDAALRATKRR